MYRPIFKARDFSNMGQPIYDFRVKKMTWAAVGGAMTCRLLAKPASRDIDLSQLSLLLRRPVEVWGSAGELAWFGYVHAVRVNDGAVSVTTSLDDLGNSIIVSYWDTDVEGTSVNMPIYTAAEVDTFSVSQYGTKQIMFPLKRSESAAAVYYAKQKLATHKYPLAAVSRSFTPGVTTVTVDCRGWWETLSWRYYSAGAAADLSTTTQISNMAAAGAGGQFLGGVRLLVTSGVSINPYRKGENDCQYEIENLLKAGDSANERMLGKIGPDRFLVVDSKPVFSTCALIIGRDGLIRTNSGITTPTGAEVVGRWAALDTNWGVTAGSWGLAPGKTFLEGVQWEDGKGLSAL